MFSLVCLPVLMFIAIGIDYGRALNAQAMLQAAVDSAALMVTPSSKTLTASQLQTSASNYVQAMLPPAFSSISVTATTTGTSSTTVTISATSQVPSTLTAVLGYTNLPIKATTSVAAASSSRQRVALVLDNSGSMDDDGKMPAMKTAAKSFLSALQAAVTNPADVYVSIIPFDRMVNVGTSNLNASWIDWTDFDNDACAGRSRGRRRCTPDHSDWNGCVADRGNTYGPSNANYDTDVTQPSTSNSATLFPAQDADCPPAVTPLTNNFTTLNNAIDALQPTGYTNQAIGLAHGWMSLVGGGPYPAPPTMDSNYQYQSTIVLLSDGLNTYNRWYGNQSSIDARQSMTCANVKAAGITLYTVHVNTGGDPTSTILQTCASDSSKFFHLTSASQMLTVFNQIGSALNQLRLSN